MAKTATTSAKKSKTAKKVPAKKAPAKKVPAKKAPAKTPVAKKPATQKKVVAKKPVAKAAKKPAAKKASAKKPAVEKTPAKKVASKKPAAKAAADKKPAAKKPADKARVVKATSTPAKKPVAEKPVAKKQAAKEPTPAAKPKAKTPSKKPAVSKAAAAQRAAASPKVDLKPMTGSVGSGLSFLAGKPGSDGARHDDIDDAPRLTKTKLGVREIKHFRDLLLTHRRRVMNDVEDMEREALGAEQSNLSTLPVHMADVGTDNYEQEFTLDLADRGRRVLDEIDHALRKIDDSTPNTYGICEGTGQMISKARLEAQPWVRFSIEYAKRQRRHSSGARR